jgi:lauroyl/myristoyl acyltransferase
LLGPAVGRFPRFFYRVALVVGWGMWQTKRDIRRCLISNLLPLCDGDRRHAEREGLRVCQFMAQYYVDLCSLHRRDMASFERDHLTISGTEHLAVLNEPGPVVIVSAHSGNPELAVQALTYRGRQFVALVEAMRPPEWSRRMLAMRSSAGGRFYESDFKGLRTCIEALKHGEALGLVGDRDIQGNGLCTRFLGREVKMPRGPWELARRTNALIIPIFSTRIRYDHFAVSVAEPFRIDREQDEDTAVRKAIEQYVGLLERTLRADPGQWLVLEDYWRRHACRAEASHG